MPTPTFDQLVQFRVDYVDSWNTGDKERFAANWRQFLADDDAFQMFDPVGTPMKRGLVGCALEPFDLWQPVVRFNVPKETFFICGNEIAWVMENLFDDNGTEVKSSSIENYTFTDDRSGAHPHLVRRPVDGGPRRADEAVPARGRPQPALSSSVAARATGHE